MSDWIEADDERICNNLHTIQDILREILEAITREKNPIKQIRMTDSYKCHCGAIINGHENVKEHLVLGCDAHYEKIKHLLVNI